MRGLFAGDQDYSVGDIQQMWQMGGAITVDVDAPIHAYGHKLVDYHPGNSDNPEVVLSFNPMADDIQRCYNGETDTIQLELKIGNAVNIITITDNETIYDEQSPEDNIYLLEYYQPYEEQQEQE